VIRLSRPGDDAALQHLWQVAFGDTQTTIDDFFSHLYQPGNAIVWAEDEIVASAIYLLDAGTFPPSANKAAPGRVLRASYSYALATLPDHRGRGLGAAVTTAAIRRSAELGFDCNLICPAEEGLFAYYTRLGYHHTFSIASGELSRFDAPEHLDVCRIMSTDLSAYSQLRQPHLPASALVYPSLFLRYMAHRAELSGGGLYRLELEGQTGCAAVERWENQLFVREILPASLAKPGTLALLTHFDAESAHFRTTPSNAPSFSLYTRPFVLMATTAEHPLISADRYAPFVLD